MANYQQVSVDLSTEGRLELVARGTPVTALFVRSSAADFAVRIGGQQADPVTLRAGDTVVVGGRAEADGVFVDRPAGGAGTAVILISFGPVRVFGG